MKPTFFKFNVIALIKGLVILPFTAYASSNPNCGNRVLSVNFYDQISYYSLALGFAIIFIATFIDKKKIKTGLFILSVLPFIAWVYVHFFVDFNQIKKAIFNYDLMAENTLANIAEGQERYKSENNAYLKDLEQLYSHIAGSHGINPCIQVLTIRTYHDHWTGTVQHVSSPNKISWNSRIGSSLKKG